MDDLPLALFFLSAWTIIFFFALTLFRIRWRPNMPAVLKSLPIITPVSWLHIQLMHINPYFHLLNAPVEVSLATWCFVRFFRFYRVDAFLMITLAYGFAVGLENITSLIVHEYHLEDAAASLARGIIHEEWYFIFFMLGLALLMKWLRFGYTVIHKHKKPVPTRRFRIVLGITFLSVWLTNMSVHFASELLVVTTLLVFLIFGSLCVRFYRQEMSE